MSGSGIYLDKQLIHICHNILYFFFQAEDGIRDTSVTGVQTCALPISTSRARRPARRSCRASAHWPVRLEACPKIGRASCREMEDVTAVLLDIERNRVRKLPLQAAYSYLP